MSVKRQYRILNWRHDEPQATLEELEMEGKNQEECDQKAIARMNEISNQDTYQWCGVRVVRIDVPAVKEKVTHLADNGRQQWDD